MSQPSFPQRLLVTGGSRGIGAAIARMFAARGWEVGLTWSTGRQAAAEVVSSIEAAGGSAFAEACNLRSEDSIQGLYARLDARQWIPDALVNNAGVTGARLRLENLDSDTLREVCEVNLIGTLLFTREAVRRMSIRRGGRGGAIVTLSSTATRLGSPDQWVHYAATKGAVDVFTRGLAHELAPDGLRVNAVSPGLTLSDPAQADQIAARLETLRHEIPMQRAGTAEEVAEAVYFLCSERASYITGTILPAAGGR